MIREGPTSIKFGTTCCALGILSCSDETPLEELQWQIDSARISAKKSWTRDNRQGGETCLTCVTTPTEKILETKLKLVGFEKIHKFNRRNGYPPKR